MHSQSSYCTLGPQKDAEIHKPPLFGVLQALTVPREGWMLCERRSHRDANGQTALLSGTLQADPVLLGGCVSLEPLHGGCWLGSGWGEMLRVRGCLTPAGSATCCPTSASRFGVEARRAAGETTFCMHSSVEWPGTLSTQTIRHHPCHFPLGPCVTTAQDAGAAGLATCR